MSTLNLNSLLELIVGAAPRGRPLRDKQGWPRSATPTVIALVALLLAACAKPAANTNQAGAVGNTEPPRIASTDVVKATPEELTLAKGESGTATVRLLIDNGYHINANPASYAYLKPTELELTAGDGISVAFITYPDPITKRFSFADEPLAVYEGETLIKAMLKADKSAGTGKHNLSAKLRVQACDDQVCYAPGAIDLTIPVAIK